MRTTVHPHSSRLWVLPTSHPSVCLSGCFVCSTNIQPLQLPFPLCPPMGCYKHIFGLHSGKEGSLLAHRNVYRVFAHLFSECFSMWQSLLSMSKWMENLIKKGYTLQFASLPFGKTHYVCALWFSMSTQDSTPFGADPISHQPWPRALLYAFHQVPLIPYLLAHIQEESLVIILVAPEHTSALGFPSLIQLLWVKPLQLPWPDLLLQLDCLISYFPVIGQHLCVWARNRNPWKGILPTTSCVTCLHC